MRLLTKLAVLVVALLSASGSSAQTFGRTSTYGGLTWSVSTNMGGFTSCNQLYVDATGDATNSNDYVIYGTLNCANGTYFSSGNAYFATDGSFNMSVSIGVAYKLVCVNLRGATLSGSCIIYDNLGNQTGTAFVSYPWQIDLLRYRSPGLLGILELHGSLGLLLHDDRSSGDAIAMRHVTLAQTEWASELAGLSEAARLLYVR
jgi:hypothetical protein